MQATPTILARLHLMQSAVLQTRSLLAAAAAQAQARLLPLPCLMLLLVLGRNGGGQRRACANASFTVFSAIHLSRKERKQSSNKFMDVGFVSAHCETVRL